MRNTASKRPAVPSAKSLKDGGRAGAGGRSTEGLGTSRKPVNRPKKTRVMPARPASRVITSAMRPSRVVATRVAAANAMAISTTPGTTASRRTSAVSGDDVGPQPPHAFQPPVIVIRLSTKVLADLRARKDQEPLVTQALLNDFGDCFGLERGAGEEVDTPPAPRGQHVGLD